MADIKIQLYKKTGSNFESILLQNADWYGIPNKPTTYTPTAHTHTLDVEAWNTATKTLALSDANKLFICSSIGNQTLTIPTNEDIAFPIGTMITFLLTSTNAVTFSGASGVTLTSMDSLVELATQYGMASLIKTDTNTWQLVGALERKTVTEPIANYVRFVSGSLRTIKPRYDNSGVTLQYSVDSGATWTTIASDASTTSATEHWFRGQATGTKTLFTSSTTTNAWWFSGNSDLEVYGNLNFLLCDALGDEEAPTSLGTYAYAHMFRDCTSLTTAPELPATALAEHCYRSMFYGCTSLTTAPALPAKTLAENCYYSMFNGCTSLTTAPALPATTMESNCYYGMFNGCTSLTTAPELPATTVADSCYRSMFYGCTSLTTAPELPATALAEHCYRSMFYGCTSLTTAPALPAKTLAENCYYSMFRDCTFLTTAPELPATTLGNYCYYNMFFNCSSLKVSSAQSGSYIYAWRIPTSGTGTTAYSWNIDMLKYTNGTFKGNPTINTTYYVVNKPV